MIDEVKQSKEGADVILSKESDEERVDHSLKALETLSKAAQFKLNMEKARKVSEHDLFIQQCPRGSGEGSGVNPEVPDELTL
ncbi:hypothetical protein Tco_0470532, partial [Tanacetum coccineum]